MIKFDINTLNNIKRYNEVIDPFGGINVYQIEWLSGVEVQNSSLPEGVVFYHKMPIGVIYPHYFEGYDSFLELYKEDSDLILDNLTKAINYNLELIDHDIVNTDFCAKNILYSGTDVQLIDLSGKYITRGLYDDNYVSAYGYFMPDLYSIIYTKLVKLYGKEESKRIMLELRKSVAGEIDREKPLEVVETVRKMRVLK